MKKNLFIFAVSIISVLGVYSGARADIASTGYVDSVVGNLSNDVDEFATVVEGRFDRIQDRVDNIDTQIGDGEITVKVDGNAVETIVGAINALDANVADVYENMEALGNEVEAIVDAINALDANSVDASYAPADKYKVLTVGTNGNVAPDMIKIPIGQNAGGGVAQIWIEQ